jgi:hypothetical protein
MTLDHAFYIADVLIAAQYFAPALRVRVRVCL